MSNSIATEKKKLAAAIINWLVKQCFLRDKKPSDFIGHKLGYTYPNGEKRNITITKDVAITIEEFLDTEVKKGEKRILYGDSANKQKPKGILSTNPIDS